MNTEPTRVRKQGTKVTLAKTGKEIIEAIRNIVTNRQYAKVNGYMIDGYTANAIILVYDAVNQANKERMEKLTIPKMAAVAFKFVK